MKHMREETKMTSIWISENNRKRIEKLKVVSDEHINSVIDRILNSGTVCPGGVVR